MLKFNYLKILKYTLFTTAVLYFGKPVLTPLGYAVFISFVLFPIVKWLECRKIHRGISILIGLSFLFAVAGAVVWLLIGQALSFSAQWPQLQLKIDTTLESAGLYLNTYFGITVKQLDTWIETMTNKMAGDAVLYVGNTVYLSALSLFRLILIPVYAALILYNRESFVEFLFRVFYPDKREELISILRKVIFTYYNFIKGMLIIYFVNGSLISIGLYFLGVPNPLLFGFISSILSIIPYVGIVAGAILPLTLAWAVHGNLWYVFGVVGIFLFVHVFEAYVVFPIAVSYRLKISTFFTLIAIFTGGLIWGTAGMILFIPALGIVKLILETLPGKQPLAKLLEG